MSWIESRFRPYIDYAAHRQVQRKRDASEKRTMFSTVWTVVQVKSSVQVVLEVELFYLKLVVHHIIRKFHTNKPQQAIDRI